jgi:hypothetical protein
VATGPWYIPWLYPASSEPPPQPVEIEWWDSPLKMPQFPPWRPTHYEQSIFEPIPDEDIPFVESTWQMVFTTWSVATAASAFDFEEEPLIPLPEFRTMPLYPQWMPPDHPSYYSDEPEVVHPEVFEYRTLPIWLPWRPIPHLDYFSDEQEEIFIDKYQNLPRLPVWIPRTCLDCQSGYHHISSTCGIQGKKTSHQLNQAGTSFRPWGRYHHLAHTSCQSNGRLSGSTKSMSTCVHHPV